MSAEPLLRELADYCAAHPDERFWQALRNWAGYQYVFAGDEYKITSQHDTFFWEGRRGKST